MLTYVWLATLVCCENVPRAALADAALSPEEFLLKGEIDHAQYLEKIAKLEKQLSVRYMNVILVSDVMLDCLGRLSNNSST